MRKSLYDYCVEHDRTELLDQWDEAANLPVTPQTVTYGSKQKVAWRCERGHTWRAQVCSRTGSHAGCPVCAGLAIIPGENDLATLFPAVAAQWHPTKNTDVTPSDVGAYTHRKAWWRCETCGHEWQAVVKSRAGINKCGCPVCAGKAVLQGYNDLATLYPNIASEWHPTLNGALTPQDVTSGSGRRVWWQCAVGHVWRTAVYTRTGAQRSGCPVCAGRVKEANRLMAERR